MTFVQRIVPCLVAAEQGIAADDHPDGREDCICIIGELDGVLCWHSHDHRSIDPLERANPDAAVVDERP